MTDLRPAVDRLTEAAAVLRRDDAGEFEHHVGHLLAHIASSHHLTRGSGNVYPPPTMKALAVADLINSTEAKR